MKQFATAFGVSFAATRAFERWTGVPPREFRRRVVEGSDPVGS
jgi:AraC-like DNA-binding protein